MSTLKRLGAALVLTFLVAISASAGITECPPAPGLSETPPCAAEQTSSDDCAPGQTPTPPAASAGSEYSFTGLALDVIESALFLF